MDQDPKIRKLINKAFPKPKKQNLRNQEGVCPSDTSLDPDRFEVYKNIVIPDDTIMAVQIVLFIGILGIGLGTGWEILLIAVGIFFILIAIKNILFHLHHQLFFVNWKSRIPFSVSGWDAMVNRDIITKDLCWSEASLKIVLNNPSEIQKRSVMAAVKIFCDKANKMFYTRDMDADDAPFCDPRNSWKIIEKNPENGREIIAEGSANPEVIGKIFWLINGHLSMLNKTFPNLIEKILLSVSEKFQDVDIDAHYTSNG